ncbi:hypothetical protein RBB75_00545 [Tunturibacter empetritectus]|uniref:Uncharacterized protein n=1 Tax=Tunturiibacter empetritectus TaxID=3069691 RepID=A0AAU7ZD73_9BACT
MPAAPEHPIAAERLAKLAPETRSPACTSGRTKRSALEGWKFGRDVSDEPDSGRHSGDGDGWLKLRDGKRECGDE